MGTKRNNPKKQPSSSSSSFCSPSTSTLTSSKKDKLTSHTPKSKSKSKLNEVDTPSEITQPPANILHLANETLDQIISHYSSDTKTLLTLSLVCKTFHRISSAFLWRHLKLSPWFKDLDENGDPEEDSSKKSQGRLNTSMKNGHIVLPNVKVLTLDYHPSSWCHNKGSTASLRLPNLETLYIKLQDFQHAYDFHHQGHGGGTQRRNPADHSCRLLRDIYPKTIIIHQVNIKYVDLENIQGIPLSVWKNCEELILIASSYQWLKPNGQSFFNFPATLNMTGLKITWIFDPSEPNPSMGYNTKPSEEYKVSYLLNLVLNHPDTPLTIINPSCHKLNRSGFHEKAMTHFSDCFAYKAGTYAWTEEDIDERLGKVKFHTMHQWVGEQGNWLGKIEEEEVKRWRDIANSYMLWRWI
ncbi:hypothetical protein I302_100404 [Kwoniella bestiolae CBS 10118]|uniref:F-box domain-containing protein n=1 Tax=Kwoniella bestiolae CBS 10118 TaxID=1296100 RepID=A0A1B9G519_9TREE|nr:hypothetical protein I302_03779 [Kwoniella bestiolae CBS 10118]OCF26102.1 hypothetical protein I302_03779 [Kwoniella bestiolae CBS 10118]